MRTLTDFAREKIGALVVICGRDLIVRHLEGGEECNGKLSDGLLKSIFDSHSIGHDGAVIIEGNQISQFSVHLPLSKNLVLETIEPSIVDIRVREAVDTLTPAEKEKQP